MQHVINGVVTEDDDEHDGEGVSIIGVTMSEVRRIKASRGSGMISGRSTTIPCGIRSWQQVESIPSRTTESTMHCNMSCATLPVIGVEARDEGVEGDSC